jgi:hypothetical protein
MQRLILGIGIVLGVALSSGASFAQTPGCNGLIINLTASGWAIAPSDETCNHGFVASSSATQVVIEISGFYGPDCRLGFTNSSTGALSIVEFQEDYCALKAGDITVTSIEGPVPQYTVTEGSYSPTGGTPGSVTVTGFQ